MRAKPPASGNADINLTVNGNNPVVWKEGTSWADNLGALFTHDGQTETIYSTSTVDVNATGTTTIDYWAQIPGGNFLRATRQVVVQGAGNDNFPLPILSATGTDATTTAQ